MKKEQDEYYSVYDYYESIVKDPLLLEQAIDTMSTRELIEFYNFVDKRCFDDTIRNQNDYIVASIRLETTDTIMDYLNEDIQSNLSEEEKRELDEIVELLERRKEGPVKKLVRNIKNKFRPY